MNAKPPASLILMTIGSFILVNVVAAQVIVRLASPESGLQFSWGFLLLILAATAVLVERTIRRWRAYLRLARRL